MRYVFVLLLFVLGVPSFAQDLQPRVRHCGDLVYANQIAEPWEENTRTFANGAVRLALIDKVEPAAASAYLMILSPPYFELGIRQCLLVGNRGLGFAELDFSTLRSRYEPAKGLIFNLEAGFYVTGGPDDPKYDLEITLNQTTGEATARVLGRR